MPVTLYRRHRAQCEGGHPEDSKSGEFEEGRRGWKRCACLIHASGTLGGKFNRKQTGKHIWEEAKAISAQWEAVNSWNGEAKPIPAVEPIPAPQPEPSMTVEQATASFLTEFEKTAAENTKKKYRMLMAKLRFFAEGRGLIAVEMWKPMDVRDMRASWAISPQTAAKNMSTIKAFFEFCLANEWITRNPARLVKNPRTRDAAETREEQKLPFSDDELKLMYDKCKSEYNQRTIKWSRATHGRRSEVNMPVISSNGPAKTLRILFQSRSIPASEFPM